MSSLLFFHIYLHYLLNILKEHNVGTVGPTTVPKVTVQLVGAVK